MTSKGETWSLGTNSRLPFDGNVMLILSTMARREILLLLFTYITYY